MTINKIKEIVSNNMGISKRFVFHGSRNQNEEFNGMITAKYPAVFVITLNNGQIRSYSYSDLLICNLEIID